MACEDRECICFAFVCVCVVGKNPKTHKLSPRGWRRHYTGRYRSSGISGECLWVKHTFYSLLQLISLKKIKITTTKIFIATTTTNNNKKLLHAKNLVQ